MPSLRKIYKQGSTPVISLPPNVMKFCGASLGSHLIIYPISPTALIAEVSQEEQSTIFGTERIRQMRSVIVRKVYRQGNSFVCSISAFVLDRVGIGVGDYLSIQTLSDNAFTLTAKTSAQVSFEQSQGRIPYRNAERANPG